MGTTLVILQVVAALVAADLDAPKGTIDPRLEAVGGEARSVPPLPLEPAAHGEIIRGILEDIADCAVPAGTEPGDVLDVLAAIDAAPVAYRAPDSEKGNRGFPVARFIHVSIPPRIT